MLISAWMGKKDTDGSKNDDQRRKQADDTISTRNLVTNTTQPLTTSDTPVVAESGASSTRSWNDSDAYIARQA